MDVVIVFVKHPLPGEVKTRLAADIGDDKALAIYQALLAYTHDVCRQAPCEKVIFYGNTVPETDRWSEAGYARYLQAGDDLGARMEQAFSAVFDAGAKKAVLIGSDCPQITPAILQMAFACLDEEAVVLGPAQDGGYYLIGMRKLFSPVFHHKTWSAGSVLSDTLRDLKAGEISYGLLPTLADVDTADDLRGTFLEALLHEA